MLMADPTSSSAAKLTLHGRVLAAVPAVSKDDADKLREDRDKKGGTKTDRRNLYLMREGGERAVVRLVLLLAHGGLLQSSSRRGPWPRLSTLQT